MFPSPNVKGDVSHLEGRCQLKDEDDVSKEKKRDQIRKCAFPSWDVQLMTTHFQSSLLPLETTRLHSRRLETQGKHVPDMFP
jgi:hypothetical protein